MNTKNDWQSNIAPFLSAIEMRAFMIRSDVQKLDPLVKVLQGKDIPFETKAEDGLEKTRQAVLDLLNAIEGIQEKMRGVHVTAARWSANEAELAVG